MVRCESRPSTIGPITLDTKQTGAPSAGNPHAGCDVAGAGNGFTVWLLRHSQRKRGATARLNLRNTAPVLDPTGFSSAIGPSLLARLSILIRPTNDNLRVARDPPGIVIRQPLFAFPRHSFGKVIKLTWRVSASVVASPGRLTSLLVASRRMRICATGCRESHPNSAPKP
jgi:hypothetical protein